MISKIDTSALSRVFSKAGKNIESGIKEAVQEVAEFAQKHAQMSTLYQGNELRKSIRVEPSGSFIRTVIADKPYAYWVEHGRGPVRPVNKKVLRFVINGEVIFSKYAKATVPRPFMKQAQLAAEREAPSIIERVINRHVK